MLIWYIKQYIKFSVIRIFNKPKISIFREKKNWRKMYIFHRSTFNINVCINENAPEILQNNKQTAHFGWRIGSAFRICVALVKKLFVCKSLSIKMANNNYINIVTILKIHFTSKKKSQNKERESASWLWLKVIVFLYSMSLVFFYFFWFFMIQMIISMPHGSWWMMCFILKRSF